MAKVDNVAILNAVCHTGMNYLNNSMGELVSRSAIINYLRYGENTFPTIENCAVGMYAELTNGWIVGPIVEIDRDFGNVYVQFGKGKWQVDLMGFNNVDESSPRLIKRLLSQEDLNNLKDYRFDGI